MGLPRKFKQFEIEPAVDVPWSQALEAVVAAGVTVAVNDIVIINGVSSGLVQVTQADADAALTARGLLYVAVTGGSAGAAISIAPWRFIRSVNTAGSTIGNPVFLSGTAGGWSLTAGTVVVQVGEVLAVDATAGAIKLSPNSAYGGGSQSAGTESLLYTINDDAVAGTDEDPVLRMLGGDGAELIRTSFIRDSSADWLYIATSLSTVAATGSDRTSGVTIGPPGSANAAGNDIDSTIQLRYHVAGDAVGTWRTAAMTADAGLNALQISGSHASLLIDIDAGGALSLNSSGGAINVGDDAVAQAINIGTGAAARTITIGNATGATALALNAGTGAVTLASNATDHALTVGSVTGVSAFTAQAGTGAMTFTAGGAFDVNAVGAVTIDSTGGALGIGAGADAQAINIGTGAAARTITIGNATGATAIAVNAGTGAVTLASNATDHALTVGSVTGVSAFTAQAGTGAMTFTAGGAFDVNATGAVTIDSSGGTLGIGTDAVAQAINVGTGAAARTITIGNATGATALALNAGTGAVTLASNATDHALTVGSVTGVSAFTAQAGTGAMTLTAGGIFDVNAVGAVTIDSTGGALGIGTGADAQAVNIGTGAAARTITIGNATGATALALNAGTGAVTLASNATDHALTVGSVTGVSAFTAQAGTGAMTFTAGGAFDVNATGAVTIDSSGGTLGIGTDAVAQAVNIGTGAAARTITIGNVTGATSVVVNLGTGTADFAFNATDHATRIGSATGVSATTVQSGTGGLSLTSAGSATWQVSGNAAGTLALTLDAINAGAGDGNLVLTADNTVQFGDVGNPAISFAGSGAVTFGGNPTINLGTGALTLAGTAMSTTAAMVWTLLDNNAAALDIGSTGLTNLLRLTTTDTSETVAVAGRLTTTDGVAGGTARRVGGAAFRTSDTSASITSTAGADAETAFSNGTYTFPANTFNAGTIAKIRAMVRVSDGATAETLRCRMRLNGVAGALLANTDDVDVGTGNMAIFDMELNGHAAPGAAAEISWNGFATNFAANDANATVRMSAGIANFATNAGLDLVVTAQWTGANAGDDVELEDLSVIIIG